MRTQLKEYIEEIRAIRIDNTLSDDAVVALMNIHLCVMTMIVANQLEDEYGSADIHRESMEKLFALCRQRSAGNQSLARCSRMTPAMYNIFSMPDSVFDGRKYDSCLSRTFRMADEWSEMADRRPSDEKTRIIEYGILHSILETYRYVAAGERETERDYIYLMRRIGEWSSELDDSGSWSGISDCEAARRINLMIGHSNINRDNRFDARIERALHCCFERFVLSNCADSRQLFYIYRSVTSGTESVDYGKADILAEIARRIMNRSSSCSDEWLWSAAVAIDRECAGINNEIKQNMRAHSA